MKAYEFNPVTKENLKTVSAEMITDLIEQIRDTKVNSFGLGEGFIVKHSGDYVDQIIVTIDFAEETKRYSLSAIANNIKPPVETLYNKNLVFFEDDDIKTLINDYIITYNIFVGLLRETEAAAKAEAVAKAKADAKAAKEAEQFEKTKEKTIKDFEAEAKVKRELKGNDEFFYAIGWLAKNAGTCTARMPDYLESLFVKQFGDEAHRYTIDSTKRTVNGYKMQWALSFDMSLKHYEECPACLKQYCNESGKKIVTTSFIWDLVECYGFQFTKKQDIEKIKANIPAQYIEAFEEGFNS